MNNILNISAYQFISLSSTQLPFLRINLIEIAQCLHLKGTILLSPEGINIALSGTVDSVNRFKNALLQQIPQLRTIDYHKTYSNYQPFQNLFVKIKKQIIPFPIPKTHTLLKEKSVAPYITPHTLLDWMKTNKNYLLLDTRNQYEVEKGSFQKAFSLSLKSFQFFPDAIQKIPVQYKKIPVVTFCTGGIRCEKASLALLQHNFQEVYQLKGGILNYFQTTQAEYYEGGCFVFDERQVIYPNKR